MAVDTIRLTSSAFDDEGAIPEEYTCDGGNVSPPLEWTDVPDGVRAFALIVTDPDAEGFVHWVLSNIPHDIRQLAAGEGDAVGGPEANDFDDEGWGGPCPPSGTHRYVFTLYALSAPLEHGSGIRFDAEAARRAMDGKVLATGTLAGTYERR